MPDNKGIYLKVDRFKNDKLTKAIYMVWLTDKECVDIFIKKFLRDNNIGLNLITRKFYRRG